MSADSAVTYTSVHSEARSWSIPSEDPYEEAARQLLKQAPRSPEYVPDPIELEDHVPVYIPELEHPEDLVPAEDEAPTPPLPPSFLSPRIQSPHTRAAIAQMRATAPSTYHLLLPSGTPPLLPIPLPAPSTSRRADILEDLRYREEDDDRLRDGQHEGQLPAIRAEIEVLRRERLTYEQESIQTRQDLARSEAYYRALEARVIVLETEVLIDQGVVAAIAKAEASRVRNGYACNVVGLQNLRWFEKMESVFSISNCTASCQVKFATCTLQDDALTWWNTHVKTTTPEAAHAMSWATLKKMMTDKGNEKTMPMLNVKQKRKESMMIFPKTSNQQQHNKEAEHLSQASLHRH
ncbi:hypothetical protein Tco_0503489 [Tanacetum coccineum]